MRTLFVGDIHGCARALERLIRLARADRVILLGDLFTRGPEPRRVWELVEALRPEAVLGNHDHKILKIWEQPGSSRHGWTAAALPEAARDWLAQRPLFIEEPSWIAVHAGLHPTLGVPGTSPVQAMNLRRWPDDSSAAHAFWWQLYQGSKRVIYGHDALRGVQVHPHTLGLDSGCVYGGPLTGYLWEEERLLSVRQDE